jgi:SNF2 family DNA or RNA helicase
MDTFSLYSRCTCGHTYHEEKCTKKECTCRVYNPGSKSVRDKLQELPFKLVIADEAHSFKNSDSNRSQALVKFMNFMNVGEATHEIKFDCPKCKHTWIEEAKQKFDKRIGHQVIYKNSRCPKCEWYVYVQAQAREKQPTERPCGLILLTGTPILNRADEYFVPLNLVNPELFSSQTSFQNQWLEPDHKGRYSRIKKYRLEEFKKVIKPYLLRREKEDVYTDLPVINRIFTLIEPDKSKVKERYNQILDKIDAETAHKANPTYWDLKEHLAELRRLCGMMKLLWTNDYLETCALESASKYAIGIHHESVRDVLYTMLGGSMNCYRLSGQDSAEQKDYIMREWEHSNKQFLIVNMLAGGVGMDFHYCDNVVVLERQWNSEIEAQFEFRFYNPDKSIKQNPTTIEYVIAKGTIDEFWYDMVEEKRRNVGEVMYNNFNIERDVDSFQALVDRTLQTRL